MKVKPKGKGLGGLRLSLIAGLLSLNGFAHAETTLSPKALLLSQYYLSGANFRSDIATQALNRLQLIAPDDPQVLFIRIQEALAKPDLNNARLLYEKLKTLAPNTLEAQHAEILLKLAEPQAQQQLQQARLLALAGHYQEARKLFDGLFQGDPPTPEITLDYWRTVSRIPGQEQIALSHLQNLYQFAKNLNLYQETGNPDSWPNALAKTLSSISASLGKNAFKAKKIDIAQSYFQQALQYNPNNDDVWLGLGDVALEKKNYAQAEEDYKKALVLDPSGIVSVYGLISVYKQQSPQKAIDYIATLSENKKARVQDALLGLESSLLQDQGDTYLSHNQMNQALGKYLDALKKTPDDVWVIYHIASIRYQMGQHSQADNEFRKIKSKFHANPLYYYAYALYYSGTNREQEGLAILNQLPKSLWDVDIQDLAQRIKEDLTLQYAETLRDQGHSQDAIAYLAKQPQTTRIRLTLGDWALLDKKYPEALAYYRSVESQEPGNVDARLGVIQTLIAEGQLAEAHSLLDRDKLIYTDTTLNNQRKIADAWMGVNELQKANTLFQKLKRQAMTEALGEDTALVFRDAALLEDQLQLHDEAKNDYKHAMVYSGITNTLPKDNDTYTYLTRIHPKEDWLTRSVRYNAAKAYKKQETEFILAVDYWSLAGTQGISNYTAKDVFAQVNTPLRNGKAFVRADEVALDAGTFNTTNGIYENVFGTCIDGCSSLFAQKAKGVSGAFGWYNDHWLFDLGTTPEGFDVPNVVGSFGYRDYYYDIGWTLLASRRPIPNSMLSYAGRTDPNTGIVWGGVVATGLTLALNYDLGQSYGLWANLGTAQVTGKNVETNDRVRLMDGYYYRLINEDNQILSVGINNMIWHYRYDLENYSLGQGGYFSPQFFLSFSLPVYYRARTENWSYEFGGNIGYSWTTVNDNWLYPIPEIVPEPYRSQNFVLTGARSSGMTYSLLAMIERRLSDHFVLGALFDYQQSRDFTPSHASIYVRYSLEGWEGDMPLPIVPPITYSNF